MGSEAEMRSARAERDVLAGAPAGYVEAVRILELLLVPVRADIPRHDLVSLTDRLTTELVIPGRRPSEMHHGRRPTKDLLDRVRDQRGVVSELRKRVGI